MAGGTTSFEDLVASYFIELDHWAHNFKQDLQKQQQPLATGSTSAGPSSSSDHVPKFTRSAPASPTARRASFALGLSSSTEVEQATPANRRQSFATGLVSSSSSVSVGHVNSILVKSKSGCDSRRQSISSVCSKRSRRQSHVVVFDSNVEDALPACEPLSAPTDELLNQDPPKESPKSLPKLDARRESKVVFLDSVVSDHDHETEELEPPPGEDARATSPSSHSQASSADDAMMPEPEQEFRLHQCWEDKPPNPGSPYGLRRKTLSYFDVTDRRLTDFAGEEWVTKTWYRMYKAAVMYPASKSRVSWEAILAGILIFDIVVIPLAALRTYDARDELMQSTAYMVVCILVKLFWLLDIAVSFISAFHANDGTLVVSPQFLWKRYIKSWFVPDLVAAFFDWSELGAWDIVNGGIQSSTLLLLSYIFRFLRLLGRSERLLRDHIITDFCLQRMPQSYTLLMTIVKYIMMMIGITHIVACLWYAVGDARADGPGWVKHANIEDEPMSTRYIWSLHSSVALYTNSDPIQPYNLLERYVQTVLLFLAFVISTMVVSSITTAMTQLHIISGQRSSQFAALSTYLQDNCISRDLATKVQRNARFVFAERSRHSPESSIELLNLLSEPLRVDLNFEVNSVRIFMHPLFSYFNVLDHTGCKRICHKALTRLFFSSGELVFENGDECDRMYFVLRGSLDYVRKGNPWEKESVNTSHWLSEASLWTKWVHKGDLRGCTDTVLLALDATVFQNQAGKTTCMELRLYGRMFVQMLSDTTANDLTDINSADDPDIICILDEAFMEHRPIGSHRSSLGNIAGSIGLTRSGSSTGSRLKGRTSSGKDGGFVLPAFNTAALPQSAQSTPSPAALK